MINIGITCQLSKSIWSGSIKQSAINLYDCLSLCGFKPIYLSDCSSISEFNKEHKALNINQILFDKFPKLDIIIIHGFMLTDEEIQEIKKVHKNCKIILYYNTNRITVDQQNLLSGKNFINRIDQIDEIWIHKHHADSAQYVKAYHGTDATVKTIPFLWSPYYINLHKSKKDLDFNPKKTAQVLVLEPNQDASRTCLLPLLICENFNRSFGKKCASFSFFNTERLKVNKGAKQLISKFSSSEQNKIFLNKSWKSIDAIDRLGHYVLSHHSNSELNYLLLECLHLNLPLIHNSTYISGYGYYYPSNDIHTASNQIFNAISNHKENLPFYEEENKKLINTFLPSSENNINFFKKTISLLLKK